MRQGKGQPIRDDGPQTHLAKRGTPTMGGLMILTSLVLAMLLWMDLTNPFVWACLFVTLGFGAIGFLDDYDKVTKRSHKGVSGRVRLLAEFAIAGIATWLIVSQNGTHLYLPFFTDRIIAAGAVLLSSSPPFMIVGFGNAVNLTDGLDGLATMPVIIAGRRLHDHRLSRRPRRLFATISAFRMCRARAISPSCAPRSSGRASPSCGSTRRRRRCSWAIPAASRWAARSARSRWPRITRSCCGIVGGLFVVEALSVIIQVFFYKRTGKRVFRMAPIHHHFEQLGWAESTVVIRFWIISFVLALRGPRDAEAAVITSAAFRGKALCGAGAGALGAGDGRGAGGERRQRRRVGPAARMRARCRWQGRAELADPLDDRPDGFRRRSSFRPACRSTAIRSPSARASVGVPIIGDIELFALARPTLPPHKVVGITGTNGKSTTTALIHHILQSAGIPARMGGNIGLPILAQEPLPDRRRLCAGTVELPDRPDLQPRLRCRGAAQHHARPSRSL